MSLSTISRCFLITLILYLWLYRFICQVYAHPRPKVGLQVFAFIFYLPPTIDTPLIITRARHLIRKSYPPKNEQNIEYSSESFYMYVFFVLWCLIFLIYPFVIVIPQSPLQSGPLPYSNCFPIC